MCWACPSHPARTTSPCSAIRTRPPTPSWAGMPPMTAARATTSPRTPPRSPGPRTRLCCPRTPDARSALPARRAWTRAPIDDGATGDIMTTARFSLRALWCDQGMAHMLETYDSNEATAPSGLALVDFGAETMFKSSVLRTNIAAPAVTTILNMLILQVQAGLPPKLDYVVISHQDTDHWSLLNYLMDAVDKIELPMKVGKI
ncbi:MAG: MBL fold metallo-hydrolase, partial [Hyphomicrobiales bacterium]